MVESRRFSMMPPSLRPAVPNRGLGELPVLRLARPARVTTVVAWLVGTALALAVPTLTFAPWQQSAHARGEVIAFAPQDREQAIEAPVKGRVVKWHVVEGQHVEKDALLAEIADLDPTYSTQLDRKQAASTSAVLAATEGAAFYEEQVKAAENERDMKVRAARFKVLEAGQKAKAASQKLEAAKAALLTADLDLTRQRGLFDKGLVSKRSLELAELYVAKAQTDVRGADADLSQARAAELGAQSEQLRADAEGLAKIAKNRAEVRKARSELEEKRGKLAESEVDVARQAARLVRAPRAGTLLKVYGDQFGKIVKEGTKLAELVPDTESRAVAIYVSGNDMPMISQGRRVRIQFEGWPAVQFVGWPSVAVGTFAGRVAFVDAMSKDDGKIRVVVLPDPNERPWPPPSILRQGSRAKGWVLLDTVPLGWEIWRQFNGFPPTISKEEKDQWLGPVEKLKRSK